jgi:hypothetical protein
LALAHQLRLESGVAVSGHLELERPDLGTQRFRAHTIAGAAAVTSGRLARLVPTVFAHLGFHSGLEHQLGQPTQ